MYPETRVMHTEKQTAAYKLVQIFKKNYQEVILCIDIICFDGFFKMLPDLLAITLIKKNLSVQKQPFPGSQPKSFNFTEPNSGH